MAGLESDRLDHVRVSWDDAYSCLVAHCLPVLRVERSVPEGQVAVIWRNEPTGEHRAKANRLLRGVAASHAW